MTSAEVSRQGVDRARVKAAIIGSGNIGTDLMMKILRTSSILEMGAMVGIDPDSDGLRRAAALGVAVTHEGIAGLQRLAVWPEIGIVFDATSAGAHQAHNEIVHAAGKTMIDLTPAAIGPFVIPVSTATRISTPPMSTW